MTWEGAQSKDYRRWNFHSVPATKQSEPGATSASETCRLPQLRLLSSHFLFLKSCPAPLLQFPLLLLLLLLPPLCPPPFQTCLL